MKRRARLLATALALTATMALATALSPALALASSTDAIIHDVCSNDYVPPGKYTKQQLAAALNHLPADIQEYSDCADVLRAALGSPTGGTPGGPGAAASALNPLANATPQDLEALHAATKAGNAPVNLSLGAATPTKTGLAADVASRLPTPVLIALALIAVTTLALASTVGRRPLRDGILAIRDRVHARRRS